MTRCGSVVSVVSLAALLSASLAFAQGEKSSATIEQFREFGDVIVGRWTAEITLTDDYPPIGKKGDKLVGKGTSEWILNKSAVEGEWSVGPVTGKGIVYWDGASKQIKSFGVDSTGSSGQGVITKIDDKWVEKSSGAFPDGKEISGTVTRTVADNGNTHILDWTNQVFAGKRVQDERDIWKRVTK